MISKEQRQKEFIIASKYMSLPIILFLVYLVSLVIFANEITLMRWLYLGGVVYIPLSSFISHLVFSLGTESHYRLLWDYSVILAAFSGLLFLLLEMYTLIIQHMYFEGLMFTVFYLPTYLFIVVLPGVIGYSVGLMMKRLLKKGTTK